MRHGVDESAIKSQNDTLIAWRFVAVGLLYITAGVVWLLPVPYSPAPIIIIASTVLLYNTVLFFMNRMRGASFDLLLPIQIVLDWAALFFVALFTGGLSSPSVFLFPLYAGVGGILSKKRTVWFLTAFASLLIIGLAASNIVWQNWVQGWAFSAGTAIFYVAVIVLSTSLGLWASNELRRRLELVTVLRDKLSVENERLQTVYRIALDVNSKLDFESVLDSITDNLTQTGLMKTSVIRLLTDDGLALEIMNATGVSSEYAARGGVLLSQDSIDRTAIKNRAPVYVPNVQTDERFLYKSEAAREGLFSLLSMPLVHQDKAIGVIRCYTDKPYEFSSEEVEFLELVAAQAALSIANARAYQKIIELDRSRTSFIRLVTHELRAPMAAIQSIIQIVLDGYTGEINMKQKELFGRANVRIDQLLTLVSELLELESTSAGKIEFVDVDLKAVLTKIITEVGPKADTKHIRLRLFMPPCECMVKGSADALYQVFENLVDNAIKYTRSGGHVTLNASDDNGTVTVKVADDGIGIPAEAVPKLFTEFFRAQNAKLEQVQGTGLGLAIVKRIVTLHGGQIVVASQVEAGTTFTVTLPKNQVSS